MLFRSKTDFDRGALKLLKWRCKTFFERGGVGRLLEMLLPHTYTFIFMPSLFSKEYLFMRSHGGQHSEIRFCITNQQPSILWHVFGFLP